MEIRKIIACIVGMLAIHTTYGRVFVTDTISNVYNFLDEHQLAVVHFIKVPKGEQSQELMNIKNALRTLSRQKDYQNAGIAFVGINLLDMPELERAYPIKDSSVIRLFKNGIAVKDAQGNDAELVGFVDEDAIENFIEEYFGHEINQATDAYTEDKQRMRVGIPEDSETQQAVVYRQQPRYQVVQRVYDDSYYYPRYSYYPRYYSRWGGWGGYPYGGWGGGRWGGWGGRRWWGGPGFGIGFGLGGRRGGIGFGFGF
jgi:hypothetical protein